MSEPPRGLPGTAATAANLDYYDAESSGREDYWRYMAAPRWRLRELLRLLAQEPPRQLVDLGCGGGQLLAAVGRRFPAARLVGVDLSPRQVAANRRRAPDADWHVLDLAGALPADVPRGSFDAVVAAELIEHVDDPHAVLCNALTLAAPGGRLLLTTQSGPLRETERRVGHRRHFTAGEIAQLLVGAGWEPQRVWNCGFPFHDLSKWWANRDAAASLARFGAGAYGPRERLVCALLRLLFRLNSRRRGAQLLAVARKPPGTARDGATPATEAAAGGAAERGPGATAAAPAADAATARAFASSWNHVGPGSVYSREQFVDWLAPIDAATLAGEDVLELGFGNGSLLYHAAAFGPRRLVGVELGDTLAQTRRNLAHLPPGMLELHQDDLLSVDLGVHDTVYCIGVLHHLRQPRSGFDAVLRHTRPGGRFHCWVYAREGNGLVVHVVDPLRRLTSRLPWWITKYLVASPLVLPYYLYARLVAAAIDGGGAPARLARLLPLAAYSAWIARRELAFFRHVAFDQLVAPRTAYLERRELEEWLADPEVAPGSAYVLARNGNSWKFGGRRRHAATGE